MVSHVDFPVVIIYILYIHIYTYIYTYIYTHIYVYVDGSKPIITAFTVMTIHLQFILGFTSGYWSFDPYPPITCMKWCDPPMIQCILVWWVLKFNLFIICMILYCVYLLLLFVPISTNTLNLFTLKYLEIYYHVHHQVTFQSYWVALTSMCNRIILNDRTLSSSNILKLLETITETKKINSY